VSLLNRVVIVTGGASGIGLSCVRTLIREGAKVLAADRDGPGLQVLQREFPSNSLLTAEVELSEESGSEKMITACLQKFGQLHGAINCAGGLGPYARLDEITAEDYRALIRQNQDSIFFSLKHEIRILRQQSSPGSIVNISSALGQVGFANASPYVASKHAILGLTKTAALECAVEGIRVNAICPGAVNTPLFRNTTGSTAEGLKAITEFHPVKRIAEPDEIANGAIYLLGDGARFVTGTALSIDGGWATA
jgi:NAD(P)-dependent dehydrogenase (short-subunit alcohol dehydrogenase family)